MVGSFVFLILHCVIICDVSGDKNKAVYMAEVVACDLAGTMFVVQKLNKKPKCVTNVPSNPLTNKVYSS